MGPAVGSSLQGRSRLQQADPSGAKYPTAQRLRQSWRASHLAGVGLALAGVTSARRMRRSTSASIITRLVGRSSSRLMPLQGRLFPEFEDYLAKLSR